MNKLNNITHENFIEEYNKKCPNYTYKPAIMPKVKRIISFGDIHGDYKLAIKLLKIAKLIKIVNGKVVWTGGNTYVVQVGDQIDKCRPYNDLHTCDKKDTTFNDEQSDIKILKLYTDLDFQARKVGGAVISLLGNHEIMNSLGNLSYVSYQGIKQFENYKIGDKIIRSGRKARKYAFAPGNEIGTFLGCSRYPAVIIGSNLFVHAGIVNGLIKELGMNKISDLNKINMAVRLWLLGSLKQNYIQEIINVSDTSMFWTRFLGKIPPNVPLNDNRCLHHVSDVIKLFNIGSMIIGHTPQSFAYSDDINGTCGESIWRVDNGSSEAFSHFDDEFIKTHISQHSRRPQVLEILNDREFNICSMDENEEIICKKTN